MLFFDISSFSNCFIRFCGKGKCVVGGVRLTCIINKDHFKYALILSLIDILQMCTTKQKLIFTFTSIVCSELLLSHKRENTSSQAYTLPMPFTLC